MKRGTKIGILVGSHLLMAVAGAAGAVWYLERQLMAANSMANGMTLLARQSAMLDLQHREGGPTQYRDALLAYAAALDYARDPGNPLFDEGIYRADKTLVAVRLARLEREAGNAQLADQHLNHAISTCTTIPWKNCDGNYLIAVSEKLDKVAVLGESDGE